MRPDARCCADFALHTRVPASLFGADMRIHLELNGSCVERDSAGRHPPARMAHGALRSKRHQWVTVRAMPAMPALMRSQRPEDPGPRTQDLGPSRPPDCGPVMPVTVPRAAWAACFLQTCEVSCALTP